LFRRSRTRRVAGIQAAVFAAAAVASTGCWEQWSNSWWPQMKWQKAVQAFELRGRPDDPDREIGNYVPPEGTVPVGEPQLATTLPQTAGDALANPHPPSLASLENGRARFLTFCGPCHGPLGLGNGPVAGPPYGKGPLVGVLPLAGPVGKALTGTFSDGHIFWVISNGIRRMPSYQRIPEGDRWDIVNYVRYLNGQEAARGSAAAAAAAPPPVSAPPPAAASAGMSGTPGGSK